MSDNISLKYMFDQQNMNARQVRWLAFLSEYDFEIKHIKGKENKVADALSRNAILDATSTYKTDLEEKIKERERYDVNYQKLKEKIAGNEAENDESGYKITENELFVYKNRLYIPNIPDLKLLILNEVHKSPYSGHPGYQKMITMLRKDFFWPNMKSEVAEFLARCMECQQVKDEHQHPACLLHPLPIPEWKWEVISIDFITSLPRSKKQNESVMVVVDKLSKVVHFIPVKSTYKAVNIVDVLMKEVFRLHGIPRIIISDKDVKFIGNFWKSLFKGLDTKLNFSTAYHPQTDGQTERVNPVLEDMLRMYVMDQPSKWEEYLHLVEFAYNNNYPASAKTSPFKIWYGIKCNTLISWSNPVDRLTIGPEMLKTWN